MQGLFSFVTFATSLMGHIKIIKEGIRMLLNFINNGGLELILGGIYIGWIFLIAKLDNLREKPKQEKWHW